MAVDIKGLAEIKILVDHFYLKVRHDDLLGPVFESRIRGHWHPHLQKMYTFWDSVLFASQTYKGSPFLKHYDLPVSDKHFTQWLHLFNQTIDEFFSGPKAEEAKNRAYLMSEMFQKKINAYRQSGSQPLL
ncbi:hypothetical protein C900_03529 [Fulvivirga imtechensis AK7]|uniref:Hemoglobin n=1 Tax=Fulvivirga imtechensis AK7 TaxID=1237149 RepID=L8JQP4_9BACT|nr:group III truncated hemoglobin [Fulvivirga imtechensis]ELR70548.1 hypothetical protein C900_03529 [Fulvivirga imtechensis AK7]